MSQSTGLAGIDRKAMEEERLKRLALKRGTAPDVELERATKVQKVEGGPTTRQMKRSTSGPTISSSDASKPPAPKPSDFRTNDQRGIQYPHGAFKRTWVLGQDRKNDIKIEEVLQKHDLKTAVLSAFQWDLEWVFSKLDVSKTKLVLVMEAKDETTKVQYRREAGQWLKSLRLCFPPMPGQVRCMHSKLMLLFHSHYLRIVIPTANLLNFDWGETGIMENSVFLIDLPRLTETAGQKADDKLTPFANDLLYFLHAMGLDEDIRNGVKQFDFSETKHLAFVHTIGGSHTGEALKKTGFPQLGRGVRQLGLKCVLKEPLQVAFATSSVGSLNDTQLEALYDSMRGGDPVLPTGPSKGNTTMAEPMHLPASLTSLKDRFQILFPSQETVKASKGGLENGGTICMSSKYWDNPNFPKACMREYVSTRPGILSHNKIFLARTSDKAFYYVGSANISQSAWGQMVWDRTTKAAKLNARNWECGVLVPVLQPLSDTLDNAATATKQDSAAVSHLEESTTGSEGEDDVLHETRKDSMKGAQIVDLTEDESTDGELEIISAKHGPGRKIGATPVSPPPIKRNPQTTAAAVPTPQVVPIGVFREAIDLPFEWPARNYMPGQRPWFFQGDQRGFLDD